MYKFNLTDEEYALLAKSITWLIEKANNDQNRNVYIQILKKMQIEKISRDKGITYLYGATESAIEIYNTIQEIYNTDLYHSIAATHDNKIKSNSSMSKSEFFDYYLEHKSKKWPELLLSQDALADMIEHFYTRK
jgi:hypothetical protein